MPMPTRYVEVYKLQVYSLQHVYLTGAPRQYVNTMMHVGMNESIDSIARC